MRKVTRRARYVLVAVVLIAVVVLQSQCTYVPFDAKRTTTTSDDIPLTGALFERANALTESVGESSTYFPLVDGNDALGIRLDLIQQAEKTLDLQYFLLKPDRAGAVISVALLEAANRGVRVRFLLDDIFTTASDELLAYLDSHENFELRLFNPLSRRSTKTMNFVFDFGRVNRRMHNKSMIADGTVSVFGGRNIAEEYFQLETSAEFADFDLLAIGPMVSDISKEFDTFWNDEFSVPISAIVKEIDPSEISQSDAKLDALSKQALSDVYKKALSSEYLASILNNTVAPSKTNAVLVTDTPDKLRVSVRKGQEFRTLSNFMTEKIQASAEDVLIITPYFVPMKEEVEMYQELAASGVRVRVITNSLAATNHAYVHGGYAPHRKDLLKSGVELYEVRADAPQVLGTVPPDSEITLTMHTKAAVFDEKTVFIGSMNFDPRSIRITTEVGIFLSDGPGASNLMNSIDQTLNDHTYQVGLDEKGDLTWSWHGKGEREVLTSEPGASFLKKFVATVARYLPVRGQM